MSQTSPFVDRIQTMRLPPGIKPADAPAAKARLAAEKEKRGAILTERNDDLRALLAPGGFPGLDGLSADLAALDYEVRVLGVPPPGTGNVFARAFGMTLRGSPEMEGRDTPFFRAVVIGFDPPSTFAYGVLRIAVWTGMTRTILGASIAACAAPEGFEVDVFALMRATGRFDRVDTPWNPGDDDMRRLMRTRLINVDPGCWHVPEKQRWSPTEPLATHVEALIRGMVETIEDPLAHVRPPSRPERLAAWVKGIPGRLLDRVPATSPE